MHENEKTLHFIYQEPAPTNPLKSANKKKISIHLSIYPCVDKSNPNNLDPCVVDKPIIIPDKVAPLGGGVKKSQRYQEVYAGSLSFEKERLMTQGGKIV